MSLGARLIGKEYSVKLAYTVEYDLTVKAGPNEQDAIEEAELLRFANDLEPSERDLVHTEVEAIGEIFEDDPDAHEVADWIDAPSAPSENTYWDDSRHFGESANSSDTGGEPDR